MIDELIDIFKDKTVIAIAPGSSINVETDKIIKEASMPDTIVVSVNFKPEKLKYDYVFVSNLRRYHELKDKSKTKLIVTSNIEVDNNVNYVISYVDLLNDVESVRDNAGLMLIKLLIKLGVKSIKLAGYDGYSYDAFTNYVEKDMAYVKKNMVVDALNAGMRKMLAQFSKQVKIDFITKTKYINMEEG